MLPAGAFAVVLILGGAQIMLPAPAFVEQGRVWAPGREVLQRLGCEVRWQADRRALAATHVGHAVVFPELPPPWPTPATPEQARYARRVGGLLYIPLLALRGFGLQPTWEPGARRVVLRDPTPTAVALAAILNNPAQWLDRTVVLLGDYLGWDAYPFCYATRAGPPVNAGDWVLGNEDGAIYCTADPSPPAPARRGLAAARPTAPVLTPYSALGRRLTVTGRVALAPSGVPYVQHGAVTLVTGREGVSCLLLLHRQECAAGQRLLWELVIHNPGPTGLALPSGAQMLVSVASPGGGLYVSKQSLPQQIYGFVVAAQGEWRAVGTWVIPADAPSGTYAITVSLGDGLNGLRSYRRHFEVVRPVSGETL
jgi:hypothetical protein